MVPTAQTVVGQLVMCLRGLRFWNKALISAKAQNLPLLKNNNKNSSNPPGSHLILLPISSLFFILFSWISSKQLFLLANLECVAMWQKVWIFQTSFRMLRCRSLCFGKRNYKRCYGNKHGKLNLVYIKHVTQRLGKVYIEHHRAKIP